MHACYDKYGNPNVLIYNLWQPTCIGVSWWPLIIIAEDLCVTLKVITYQVLSKQIRLICLTRTQITKISPCYFSSIRKILTYLKMSCYYYNPPIVFRVNGSLVINFNNHWKLYFKSNVFENSVHINHIYSKLCCLRKSGLNYKQFHNTLHYTLHYNNCTTQ